MFKHESYDKLEIGKKSFEDGTLTLCVSHEMLVTPGN